MKVDIAIIGAGPAGGAAACRLATSGLTIVILEIDELPRHKACGGLVPESTLNSLPVEISHLVSNRVSEREYRYNHAGSCTQQTPDSVLALVERSTFDAGLIALALEAGKGNVVLKSRFRVANVVEHDSGVVISSDSNQRVEARYLLAADGATSITARCLGLNRERVTAAGIDLEVRVRPQFYADQSSRVLFDYFCLRVGYGWIFPKQESVLSVGVAAWHPGKPNQRAMEEFFTHSIAGAEVIESSYRAHPIPVFVGSRQLASRRTCLMGDAASLVDPVTGEGIRFALESGLVAAETVWELMFDKNPENLNVSDCGRYQLRIDAGIGEWLSGIHKFCSLPFREAPDFYYRRFVTGSKANIYQ